MARFVTVEDAEGLERTFEQAKEGHAVLFLHDPWCPISTMAYEEMERVDAEVHVVDVSEQRTLSKDVQARTGIRHESPQVFVMAGGAVQWHASHGRIRKDAVGDAIQQAQPSPGG